MKIGDGFRYALEYRDPTKGWTVRTTSDDRDIVMKLFSSQPTMQRGDWRIKDRATDTVIVEAA